MKGEHPPNCTCVDCVNKRLGIITANADKGKNHRDGKPRKYPSHFPKWSRTLLVIFIVNAIGLGLSIYAGVYIPFWISLGFSLFFGVDKWLYYPLKKYKPLGKFYRIVLNLSILVLLALVIWTGVKLFSSQFIPSLLIGSLIFIAELIFFIWIWKIVSKNSWRWPSMKLTVFSLVVLFIVFSFAGVQPLSSYKDKTITNVAQWWESIHITDNSTITTEEILSATSTLPPSQTSQSLIDSVNDFLFGNTDTNDYIDRFNQYRQSKGLTPLVFNKDLNRIATLRLDEIKKDFSHNSKGGYNNHLAENIVMGVSNNQEALECWQDSPGHNANMLDASYKYTGYAIGGGYAVQVFTEWETVNGEPQLPPGWHFLN